ncbi:MAG: thioredoxin family protein [Chloroflexi bacterium]|nr:thioredoxin family protein [Chloroflexota bacterium]
MTTATSTITRKAAEARLDSAVTPERFAQGMTEFKTWMAAIEKNKDSFQRHYDEFTPDATDIATLKRYVEEHGVKMLVLGEDWCPDVWRGLPVASKIGEQSGMEVRLFLRDQNKDMMSEFLKQGEFESIPTLVLYDRDHRYLGHWIERADQANEEMGPLREILAGVERDTPAWEAARAKYTEKTWELAEGWRQAQVREVIALLREALS